MALFSISATCSARSRARVGRSARLKPRTADNSEKTRSSSNPGTPYERLHPGRQPPRLAPASHSIPCSTSDPFPHHQPVPHQVLQVYVQGLGGTHPDTWRGPLLRPLRVLQASTIRSLPFHGPIMHIVNVLSILVAGVCQCLAQPAGHLASFADTDGQTTSSPRIWQERVQIRATKWTRAGPPHPDALNDFQEAAGKPDRDARARRGPAGRAGADVGLVAAPHPHGRVPAMARRDRDGPHGCPTPTVSRRFAITSSPTRPAAARRRLERAGCSCISRRGARVRIPPDVVELSVRDRPRAVATRSTSAWPTRIAGERAALHRPRQRSRRQRARQPGELRRVGRGDCSRRRAGTGNARDLRVEFLAESVYGDEAVSQSREDRPRIFQHTVLRKSDLRPLALARTEWRVRCRTHTPYLSSR